MWESRSSKHKPLLLPTGQNHLQTIPFHMLPPATVITKKRWRVRLQVWERETRSVSRASPPRPRSEVYVIQSHRWIRVGRA